MGFIEYAKLNLTVCQYEKQGVVWLMMRMLRSDWQTKFTLHAHHQP
jgi:hypothetical protein